SDVCSSDLRFLAKCSTLFSCWFSALVLNFWNRVERHCLPLFLLATALVRMASCSLFDLPSAVCLACHLLNSSSDLPLIFHFDNIVARPICLSSFFFSVLFCF